MVEAIAYVITHQNAAEKTAGNINADIICVTEMKENATAVININNY